ncbi:unnamed protein product [Rhizophagus irregularis]|nr:unnamed protein product [Rhizophagus irregularis]
MTSITKWIDNKIKDMHVHYFEYSEFSEIVEIGRGDFGKVSKAKLANTGLVALKSLIDENSNIEEDELNRLDDEFTKELRLLCEADCENVNRILGITKVSGSYTLVLEYANEGNLRDYLEKNFTSLNWKNKIQMALDITCGLKFLHSKEMIHRDLHPKNILVNNGKLLIADSGEKPIVGTPQEYQQLYQKCWDAEPNSRPDIGEVYETLSQLKTKDFDPPLLSKLFI